MGIRSMPYSDAKGSPQFAGMGMSESGGGGGFTPPAFSTTEFDTGYKWVDGKTIYGIVPQSLSRYSSVVRYVDIPNVDKVLFGFASFKHSTDSRKWNTKMEQYEDNNRVMFTFASDVDNADDMYAVLFYTKTV